MTNTNNSGVGSLRQATLDTNSSPPGPHTINFSISGCGLVCTISPILVGFTLSGGNTTINGRSQPGSVPATATTPTTPMIEINGSATDNHSCLNISSSGNVIRGLAINRCTAHGVYIFGSGATGNRLSGNLIGTNYNGFSDSPNKFSGVFIGSGAQGNTLGGSDVSDRNLISGNNRSGVEISGLGTINNVVSGNFIGTDAGGAIRLGNVQDGIHITTNAKNSTVGHNNLIAFNGGDGVRVDTPTTNGHSVRGNRIFQNDGLGINLTNGGNGDLPAPVIQSTAFGSIHISGTACAGCTVEVFSSRIPDGEGEFYLGYTTADASGSFSLVVGGLPSPYLTATATREPGTSKFSAPFTSTAYLLHLPAILR